VADVRNTVYLTLQRAKALEELYRSEVEERASAAPFEHENQLKLLMFHIVKEVYQIFITFSRKEFACGESFEEAKETGGHHMMVEGLGVGADGVQD